MSRRYTDGIATPKGMAITQGEPLDQRTVVQYLVDLLDPSLHPYAGIVVTVEEEIYIEGIPETLREYKFIGGDSTISSNWVLYAGSTTGGGSSIVPNKFKSFVFLRNSGTPATPFGGTYASPIPTSDPTWTDGVPVGTDPLWMSTYVFTQDVLVQEEWSIPILLEDTDNIDREYCSLSDATIAGEIDVDGKPNPPLQSPLQRDYWHNIPLPSDNYMAIGTKIGGEYPTTWDVLKIRESAIPGEQGDDGLEYKPSILFARDNDEAMSRAVVSGGGFNSPTPTATTIDGSPKIIPWYDGIPAGTAKVWMTKFTFNDGAHLIPSESNIWTTPSSITDTGTTDFEFSNSLANPGDPTSNPGAWSDTATADAVWMAVRTITNGSFGPWQVFKVKGETGEIGQGLQIAGRDTICNILNKTTGLELLDIWIASDTSVDTTGCAPQIFDVPGVINDAYMYVGAGNGDDGSPWDNIGGVTGTDGVSYKYAVAFKRSVGIPAIPSGGTFASPTPSGWSDGIPVGVTVEESVWMSTRYFADNAVVNSGLADWTSPVLATDTIDFDFKYAPIQAGDITPLAPHLAAVGVWLETWDENTVWLAKGKKINGVVDDTTWVILRTKGEKGDDGDDGVPSFLSSAYIKTNDDISAISVTGGTYSSPIPTSLYSGDSWTDGVPTGPGALWFVQVKFEQTDTGNDKVWPAPVQIVDSATVEYNFSSSVSEPTSFPVEGAEGVNTWYDDASTIKDSGGTVRWMAIGTRSNGVWPTTWDIIQVIGETGATGLSPRTYIPSSMFVRADDTNIQAYQPIAQYLELQPDLSYKITGDAPELSVSGTTYVFEDGIPVKGATFPENSYRIWQITAVFNSVDHLGVSKEMVWSYPTLLADNTSIDYEYHPGIGVDHTIPPNPTADPTGWISQPDSNTYWIAQRNWAEGVTAQWVVYRIRGENGEDGVDGADGTGVEPEVWSNITLTNGTATAPKEACSLVAGTIFRGVNNPDGLVYPGSKIATDNTGTTPFNGNDLYYKLGFSRSIRISTTGIVESIFDCNTDTVPPTPPTGLAVVQETEPEGLLHLTWTQSEDVDSGVMHYIVWTQEASGLQSWYDNLPPYPHTGDGLITTGDFLMSPDVQAVKLQAIDNQGNKSTFSNVVSVTPIGL